MNYQIEVRPADDLIIIRHYHYYSAADMRDYVDDLTRHLGRYRYKRLLADYSALTEVKLNFFDKLKIIASRSREMMELGRHIRQAVVTSNDFQKAIAKQARSITFNQANEDVSDRISYFEDFEEALSWLMQQQ